MSKRILAIASAGGHWQQLMQLRPAYGDQNVVFATTLAGLADQFEAAPAHLVPDCNAHTPFRAAWCAIVLAWLLIRFRPDVIVTTGALPGVIALGLGRLGRVRTVWVDSVANAEEMSASGKLAKKFADLCLSQWQGPAEAEGVEFAGSIL